MARAWKKYSGSLLAGGHCLCPEMVSGGVFEGTILLTAILPTTYSFFSAVTAEVVSQQRRQHCKIHPCPFGHQGAFVQWILCFGRVAVCQIPVLSPPPRSACPSCPALCSSCSLLAQKPSTITGTVLWLCSNVSRPQVRLDFRCVLACLELCFSLCSYKKDFLMTKWLLPHLLNFCLALELRKIIWYNHMVTLLGLIIMSIQTIATT